MENNIRFRNHISIIIERLGKVITVIFFLFVTGAIQDLDILLEGAATLTENISTFLMPLLGVFAILAVLILWQIIVWSKTYISIQDNTIVMERNTLNQKKNTIGIKNISNVNTEQNLFEMMIGTCKVKLDTNSLSTADKTDVKIILKKADAEKFRQQVMRLMQQGTSEVYEELDEVGNEKYDVEASAADMAVHGLFSIHIFSIFVIVGCIVGGVEMISQMLEVGIMGRSVLGAITTLIVVFTFFASAVWDILKGFIVYYDFKAKRRGNKIYIKYGLFKKVNYTIPVDKINAVKVTQSLSARIGKRYMAEMINVGMGDDENEKQAFLVLYCKKEEMENKLELLLPEFQDILEQAVAHQPKSAWAAGILPIIGYLIVIFTGIVIGGQVLAQSLLWMIGGGITLFILILYVCWYLTAGSQIGERYFKVATGYFRKSLICIKYDKIQYIQAEQNFLAKKLGILKGSVFLLASAMHRTQMVPYFRENELEELKCRIVK